VFAMEDIVEYSWLLRASAFASTPSRIATTTLLRRAALTTGEGGFSPSCCWFAIFLYLELTMFLLG
jgi:hypothetical protein